RCERTAVSAGWFSQPGHVRGASGLRGHEGGRVVSAAWPWTSSARTPPGNCEVSAAAPGPARDRDRLTRNARAAEPHAIAEHLAHQQDSHIPARVPRAEHTEHERAGDPCPLRPPGKRYALPNLCRSNTRLHG